LSFGAIGISTAAIAPGGDHASLSGDSVFLSVSTGEVSSARIIVVITRANEGD
jgi:hypothetical protein